MGFAAKTNILQFLHLKGCKRKDRAYNALPRSVRSSRITSRDSRLLHSSHLQESRAVKEVTRIIIRKKDLLDNLSVRGFLR